MGKQCLKANYSMYPQFPVGSFLVLANVYCSLEQTNKTVKSLSFKQDYCLVEIDRWGSLTSL